jgi:hypothetical protein
MAFDACHGALCFPRSRSSPRSWPRGARLERRYGTAVLGRLSDLPDASAILAVPWTSPQRRIRGRVALPSMLMADDNAEKVPPEFNLRVRHYDDGTWSIDVLDLDDNVLHTATGFASQEEATTSGIRWSTERKVRDLLAGRPGWKVK